MRGKFGEVGARVASLASPSLLTLVVVAAVLIAPAAAEQTATATFAPATATAAEALAHFQRAGVPAGWQLEAQRFQEPDGTFTIQSLALCWGPSPYGYIVDFANDGHHNTRIRPCVEWASDPGSVRTRQRVSCFKDATLIEGCRWSYRSELHVFINGKDYLRKATVHTMAGGASGPYYSTVVTKGDVYYPASPCRLDWQNKIRDTDGTFDWTVRYKFQSNIIAFIPGQSSLKDWVCG
jgi:hypothetical protein